MEYKILAQIGSHYLNEEGTEGVRKLALDALEARLCGRFEEILNKETNKKETVRYRGAYELADEAKKYANELQVASLDPWGAKGRVAALVQFHTKQQDKWLNLNKANNEVIRIRQWLTRQGASLAPNGKIHWEKSMRTVEYDKDLVSQGRTQLRIEGGLFYTPDNTLFDTKSLVTHFSGPGYAIYVMSHEGNFHASSHSVGNRHHSSLLGGQSVAGAGEMRVVDGKLVEISNKSGHYTPNSYHMLQTLHSLWIKQVPLTFRIKCLGANGYVKDYLDMNAFLEGESFNNSTLESMQILCELKPHLSTEAVYHHYYTWMPSTDDSLLGGLYDTYIPTRRVSLEEVSLKLKQNGLYRKTA